MSIVQPDPTSNIISDLARSAIRKFTDPANARAWMRKQWDRDANIREQAIEWILNRAFAEAVYAARSVDRDGLRSVSRVPRPSTYATAKTNEFCDRIQGRSIFDWYTLDNGMVLGDATPEEIAPCAERLECQGRGALKSAKFLRDVMALGKPGVPTRKAVKESLIEKLEAA